MSFLGERLCEDVSNIVLGGHLHQINLLFCYLLTQEVMCDVNVLGPRVVYWIVGQLDCSTVVTHDDGLLLFFFESFQ